MGFVSDKMKEHTLAALKNGKNGKVDARKRVFLRSENTNGAKDVEDLLQPHLPAAIQAWVDGLGATKVIWAAGKAIDTGIPDHLIRSQCAQKIVEYLIGKAIERSMQVSGNYQELSELLTQLENNTEARRLLSPALFDTLRKEVATDLSGEKSGDSPHCTGTPASSGDEPGRSKTVENAE